MLGPGRSKQDEGVQAALSDGFNGFCSCSRSWPHKIGSKPAQIKIFQQQTATIRNGHGQTDRRIKERMPEQGLRLRSAPSATFVKGLRLRFSAWSLKFRVCSRFWGYSAKGEGFGLAVILQLLPSFGYSQEAGF